MSAEQKSNQSWEPFLARVRGFVAKRLPRTDVDDVVQDILSRAHASISQLREDERAEAWLFRITRRAIADFYRKRERSATGETLDESLADPTAVAPQNLAAYAGDHDVHEEVLSWLRPMAEELPEPYRTALIQSDFNGMKQRALARQLRLSESGLKSRVQRARAMLREILQRCCEVEFGGGGRAIAFHRLRDCGCDR